MTTYSNLPENSHFPEQRLTKKNYKSCKVSLMKNSSLKNEKSSLEKSIQITGFRMFLGPKHFESSNKTIYSGYSGEPSKDLNSFSIKISEPVISRVLLQANTFDEYHEGEFVSERRENEKKVLWSGPLFHENAYHDPLSENNSLVKLENLNCLSPPRPNFERQLTTLDVNHNKKIDNDESEFMETSSSFTTSSESLNFGNISDMSSLVLSNMKMGRLSRIGSFIRNMWNSSTKETTKFYELNSQPHKGSFTTNKNNKPLISSHTFFDTSNGIFNREKRQNNQDLNSITLHQSILNEKEATMTSFRNVSNGSSSFCSLSPQSLKGLASECVHKISQECVSHKNGTESSKQLYSPLALDSTDMETIKEQSHSRLTKINPVDTVTVQNMSALKSCYETLSLNKEIMESESIYQENFEKVSHVESKASFQVSNERPARTSKSVIFCPSSYSIPGNFNESLIDLCDDCYQKTRKTLSKMQATGEMETTNVTEKTDDVCKENFTRTSANQPCEFKDENESPPSKKHSHIPSKNFEDLHTQFESVNNHLLGLKPMDGDFLKNTMESLREKWILVVSDKNSKLKEISNYLKYFQDFSDQLLELMMFSTDREHAVNRFDVAEELLNYECGYGLLTQKNKLGHSPVMICAVSQPKSDHDWRVVKQILNVGDVDEASRFSRQTPLMNATSRGCGRMVELLLEAGADPNLQDSDGSTALMYAAVHGHGACVGLLMEHPKCDPRIKDYDQQTACSVALGAGHKEIALQIYLQSRRKHTNNKNKLTNHFHKQDDQLQTISDTHIDIISQSQSDHQ